MTCYSWFSTGEATDSYKLYMLVDRIVMPLLMFAAGPMVFATRARRMLLLKFMTLLTIYWGITAVGEIAHQDWVVFPRFIMNPDVGIGYGRARGPFLASEPMGMACALGFFTSGLLAKHIARRQHIPLVATFHSKYRQDFERAVPSKFIIDREIRRIVRFYEHADEVWIPQAAV